MEEETAASLLRATRGDAANDAISDAFFPFGRLQRAPVRVQSQLLDACKKRLEQSHPTDPARVLVLRALGTLGADAAPLLGAVLRSTAEYSASERAEAARSLGKITADAAQKELLRALDDLAPTNDAAAILSLVGPGFGPLTTLLGAIRVNDRKAVQSHTIERLATLPPPPEATTYVMRRITILRCAAAQLLAGDHYDNPTLVSCDPASRDPQTQAPSEKAAMARLAVLDRGEFVGPRLAAWSSYLAPAHPPSVRGAALKMLAAHAEAKGMANLVATALSDNTVGVVTEAAWLIANSPDQFRNRSSPSPADPTIVDALLKASKRQWPKDAIETVGALARACGVMGIDDARPWLLTLCADPNPTVRLQAKQALVSLGDKQPTCEPSKAQPYTPAPELHRIVGPTTIEFATDAGNLVLQIDPTLAPVAATRIVELVAKNFYDDMAVHRVVPGFVVQFGDRDGDGYGGANLDTLRCETSPVPFREGTVGIALGGRDTGSSQLFVALGPSPHLEGDYAVVGTATGPWNVLVEGDRIQKAEIKH